MAKLPNAENAEVNIDKLTSYLLNSNHVQRGANKARLFRSILGITIGNAEMLRTAILDAAYSQDAEFCKSDEFGDTYKLDFYMTGLSGDQRIVTTRWIIDCGKDIPRFTTGWPEADKENEKNKSV